MESVHVLSVSSLKGGVGKTTVTLGLASAAFARAKGVTRSASSPVAGSRTIVAPRASLLWKPRPALT